MSSEPTEVPHAELVPPGVHLSADLRWDDEHGSHHGQVRILGDDGRGYLLMGLLGMPGAETMEFWFKTLEEAQEAAEPFGVPREAWDEVTGVSEVKLQPPKR